MFLQGSLDPWVLLKACFLPARVRCICKGLGVLVVIREGVGLFSPDFTKLCSDGRYIRVPAMILLLVRVCDCLPKPKRQEIIRWTVNAHVAVVLPEVINLLGLFYLRLEIVFDLRWQTANVAIDFFSEAFKVFVEAGLKELRQLKDDEREMEARKTSFEADFASVLLDDEMLVLVGVVRVIKFRDFLDDPEDLSVKLFFEVGL